MTEKEALLWVDSRYFLQGAQQIEGTGIILMKDGLHDTPSIVEYLCENLPKGDTVGINGMLMSIDDTAALRSRLHEAGLKLDVKFDPIDRIWNDRPALPSDKIFVHDEKYAGQKTAAEKGRHFMPQHSRSPGRTVKNKHFIGHKGKQHRQHQIGRAHV